MQPYLEVFSLKEVFSIKAAQLKVAYLKVFSIKVKSGRWARIFAANMGCNRNDSEHRQRRRERRLRGWDPYVMLCQLVA